ncbi:MAG: hypothetical protein EOT05_03755 [Candidatus Microsaccharimonas sossegonensis]|uniref:Phospholipase C/D domain-containing protein n=1 Tax=Candidatus Microsaccharimonas sossegonensis TaxID=2506948 RepID=A0A4Q0AI63_9BACT|nr:MAG: hypothetical protein EOT05_03755 [Candidatus Microsaccharimonas sossegonensis]
MYAGTTYGKKSGRFIGVHQRIDRIARQHLKPLLIGKEFFPTAKDILHFEGDNGPDGIKRKSPSVDEPWHFIAPETFAYDNEVMRMIQDHQINLAHALKKKNVERASFEAAWMAHAIVDGLTPAHHYPLADKIEELFGMPHHERSSVREKNIIKGKNRRDTLSKNWQYWGKHGIFMNHFLYEFGVATAILGNTFGNIEITKSDLLALRQDGYPKTFAKIMQQVVKLETYETYSKNGWNRQLAKAVREELVPLIVRAVVLGWHTSLDMNRETK